MRILVATDAWGAQINGVVRTYERLSDAANAHGSTLDFVSPADFNTVPAPTYPEIRLALPDHARTAATIERIRPDAIHIATEGPVGWMVRRYCLRHGLDFTTSFHTRFPEYLSSRIALPEAWSYAYLRCFHNAGRGMMVATASLAAELDRRGFNCIHAWTRGVDTDIYRPRTDRVFGAGPVFLYVGRVAIEKNIEAFLRLDLPGVKVVIGSGPLLASLQRRYPDAIFTGTQTGDALARSYSSADVFVFPSRTDTFGIVLLEAMASGVPVAAFPVTGPVDVVDNGRSGILALDLRQAALNALALDRGAVRQNALTYSWSNAFALFVDNIRAASRPAVEPDHASIRLLAPRLGQPKLDV